MVSKNEWAEPEVNWAEIKADLEKGVHMEKVDAIEHYCTNPEKVIFAICKLAVLNNKDWVPHGTICLKYSHLIGLMPELKKRHIPVPVHVSKAVAFFSASWTEIKNDDKPTLPSEAQKVIQRWMDILERKKSDKEDYAYRVKQEYCDKIRNILEDIKTV